MNAFKRNLVIGFGVSLLLLIASSIASYFSINNLLYSATMVNHTNAVAQKLESVMATLRDAETGQRGFLLTKDPRFLDSYNGSYEKVNVLIAQAKEMTTDNLPQQRDCEELRSIVQNRFFYLSQLIEKKKNGEAVVDSLLLLGRTYMNTARNVIKRMQDREQYLLAARTRNLNRFAASTPVFILVASLLALLVTVVSFLRVLKDYNKRLELQDVLEKKDREISRRLEVIEGITNEISAGNYKIKIDDEGKDALGSIAYSVNRMAESLDASFTNLSDRDWFQTGIASLNEIVIVEQDINLLASGVLNFITEYSGSQAGALYVVDRDGMLELRGGYALSQTYPRKKLPFGAGLIGQAAESKKTMEVKGLKADGYTFSYISGEVNPASVIAVPLIFNKLVKGVIELATVNEYSRNVKSFLEAASLNTAIAINTAQSRQRVQELLEETQSQSEELQAQHTELENINAELQAQAEKLQASEEELKVQQEELQQSNQELEERSRLLEEKNEVILERNLQIQAKAEELSTSTKYKSEFLANMSHELRTPLNSILLLSRLLAENHEHNLSPEQIEYANVIQSSGNGLLTLIDEILDLSKIEAGKMELEYNHVEISAVTLELQSLFSPIAKDKGIEFSVGISKGVPGSFETDRLRLEQILRNLISNALKFTKKGTVQLNIDKQNGSITFSVKDTGIGIAREKQQTIFEAFQQADGSTRRQFGGTGLGLSISRELAKLLGGEIKLESEEGKGSEFTLVLPEKRGQGIKGGEKSMIAPLEHAPVEITANGADRATEKYISQIIPAPIADDRQNIEPGDKTILIVEDDTAFARSLLEYTRQKGYKGLVAVRGDEAVGLARHFRPMGILLDLQLPVRSGWDVMDELKSDPATRPIPVHMMSSHQAKTKSLSKGAVDFISKPVAFEKLGEMFAKIEEALTRHPKKVLIVEENTKHAQALSYFLQQYGVASEIRDSVRDGIKALHQKEVDCVILDMGVPAQRSYDTLEEVKKTPGFEHVPIIIFTGKNLSHAEEARIKQYADSIVIKTAQSYQRILDEVSLFLHLVEENKKVGKTSRYKRMGELGEVLRDKTVLVADDDVRNIFSVTKSLENYGMNVISAIDGKDALKQMANNKKIDIVLMDMMMPEMDGYESIRHIRKIPRYRNLPVIAVTAKAMTGDREKCIAAGASDYITKPVDVDQLISLLRVWLYQ